MNVNLPVIGTTSVAQHLYIYGTDQFGNSFTSNMLCQGRPVAGKLSGSCVFGINQPVVAPPGGTNLPGNVEIGGSYTGANACSDLTQLSASVSPYAGSGNLAPYNPVVGLRSFSGYNSNSFAFTLLNDIGLAGYYPNGKPYSWFGTLPYTPGWGRVAPGL